MGVTQGLISPNQLATGATGALVTTTETTTSTSYVDLTTTTDTVTVTIGANGLALVNLYCGLFSNNTSTTASYVSFAVSGATTVAASDTNALVNLSSAANLPQIGAGAPILVTGLTAGSNTFKMKYRVGAGTGTFANRRISVVPL